MALFGGKSSQLAQAEERIDDTIEQLHVFADEIGSLVSTLYK